MGQLCMDFVIARDDPRAEDVRALLDSHLTFSDQVTPPGHVHALDLEGLLDPAVTFFSARRDGVLLGVGARVALDPGVHGYYTAGVMVGALLWDLLGTRRPFPAWSLASFAALNLAPLLTKDAALLGHLRLGLVVAFTAALLLGPDRWYPPTADPRRPLAHGPESRHRTPVQV